MESSQSYHRYWAKTPQSDAQQQAPCHLLPYHLLDVAAVGDRLLRSDPRLLERLADGLQLPPDDFHRFFVFSLALHDIGKFARAFQSLASPANVDLVSPDPKCCYSERHDALGMIFWREHCCTLLQEQGGCGLPDGTEINYTLRSSLAFWFGTVFGHHGKPVDGRHGRIDCWFKADDKAAAWHFIEDAANLLPPVWPTHRLTDKHWREHVLKPESWPVAGLAVLADWLGSDQRTFGYLADPIPLETYWESRALPNAEAAVDRSGLFTTKRTIPFPGFADAFGFSPAPLQSWAENVQLEDGPQLFLLEDITGSGKTEAALTLAHRLMAASHGDGVFFALPTMATSNAMYSRVGAIHRRFFSEDSRPSLVLAHGARHLHEEFNRSILPEPAPDRPYTTDDPGGSAQCSRWVADHRKKALLADVGVGTVDQALLGVLPRRHQSLRLLGLARKVLVVDEVHAYDTYTGTLLERLLETHARQGGSAILLSATIPQALRRRLIEAWKRGATAPGKTAEPQSTAFPLATHVYGNDAQETPVSARPASRRKLPVTFIHSEEDALSTVLSAVQEGRCACWIRNTVDDAIAAYERLRAEMDDPEKALLFHARFTMADRQRIETEALQVFGKTSGSNDRAGRAMIATQVVEQSLDLDFDVLVTDLAPIDLVIQRAGRLHRHARDGSGAPVPSGETDEREPPRLYIHAPEWADNPASDWLRRPMAGTSYVYRDVGQLWLTCKILRELGAIRLPEEARTLLEAVYAPDVDLPEGLVEASGQSFSEQQVHKAAAGFNVLRMHQGYSEKSAEGGWSDNEEVGTRISDEPTVQVVLLREDSNGVLHLWTEDTNHPWAMSTVQLRESQARRLPELPERVTTQVEQLRVQHPQLRYVTFWIPTAFSDDQPSYNAELGAVIPRYGGERS